MSSRSVPRVLSTEQDVSDAAEDMDLPRVDFSAWPDEHLRALAYQVIAPGQVDYDIRTAARLAWLGRVGRASLSR